MVVYAVVLLCLFLAAVIPFISLVVHLDCVWFSFWKVLLLQKGKTSTKRVEPEAASSEAATLACYNFRNTLDSAFRSLFFQIGGNREMFHSCFKEDREGVGLLVVSTKHVTTFPQHIPHNSFCTTHSWTKQTLSLLAVAVEPRIYANALLTPDGGINNHF